MYILPTFQILDQFFYQILTQTAIILFFLERDLFLDHRDLKANNLYICETPVEYTVDLSGVSYRVKAPFQVVILDFGFACIGGESGLTRVNIGLGVFPMNDPCPKDGRDLFHLVTSFWSIPSVRERMSAETHAEVDWWLTKEKRDYSRLAQKFKSPEWVYVVTSQPEFLYPKLAPLAILQRFRTLGLIDQCHKNGHGRRHVRALKMGRMPIFNLHGVKEEIVLVFPYARHVTTVSYVANVAARFLKDSTSVSKIV
jgi:serine/threonine protein kinase